MTTTTIPYISLIKNIALGLIDVNNDDFKVMLVNGYSFDEAHENLSSVIAYELDEDNGYETGGFSIENVSWSYEATSQKWMLDGDDVSLIAVDGDVGPMTGAVIYSDTSVDKKLLGYVDFGQIETLSEGSELKITFTEVGIFSISLNN